MSANSNPINKDALSTTAFWEYSLKTYASNEVQENLLQLQDIYVGNVNLALLCMYLDTINIELDDTHLAALHSKVMSFSKEFTQQIRSLRNTFKAKSPLITQYSKLKQHLLNAELELEKQEQELLLENISGLSLRESNEVSTNNLEHYRQLLINDR